MIAALGGVLTLARSKAVQWSAAALAVVGAVLGFALFERHAGALGVETADLKRELADSRKAAEAAHTVDQESDAQVLADLLRNARP